MFAAPRAIHTNRIDLSPAAAPYLHSKLTATDAKLSPAAAEPGPKGPAITVTFVMPERDEDD